MVIRNRVEEVARRAAACAMGLAGFGSTGAGNQSDAHVAMAQARSPLGRAVVVRALRNGSMESHACAKLNTCLSPEPYDVILSVMMPSHRPSSRALVALRT